TGGRMSNQPLQDSPRVSDAPAPTTALGNGAPAPAPLTPLDAILEASAGGPGPDRLRLDEFLSEPAPWKALARWLGPHLSTQGPTLQQRVGQQLARDIARLDRLLSDQVNAILHHPRFQRLEASWRGLHYLVGHLPEGENLKVRVLNLPWAELVRDL